MTPVALTAARIEEQLRGLIREGRVDPIADRPGVTALVAELVADDQELAAASDTQPEMSRAVRLLLERRLVEAVSGFGPLQPYLDDPTVEEIWINERLTGGSARWRPAVVGAGCYAWWPGTRRFLRTARS